MLDHQAARGGATGKCLQCLLDAAARVNAREGLALDEVTRSNVIEISAGFPLHQRTVSASGASYSQIMCRRSTETHAAYPDDAASFAAGCKTVFHDGQVRVRLQHWKAPCNDDVRQVRLPFRRNFHWPEIDAAALESSLQCPDSDRKAVAMPPYPFLIH